MITTLPVDYTYGFSQLNTHLIQNASIIINRYSLLQKEFWNLLQKSKATTFGGVPFSFEVLKKLKSEKLNFYNVKNITQAGGKLNEDLQIYFSNVFKKKKIKFFIMYGSTEATSRMTYLPPKYISKKIGSVGISIPKTKIEIDKSNVNKNEHGEVIFFGKNVSLGYLENLEDLSLDNQNKGVLRTGDIGYKDEDNFLYITGRLKRFIKLFGHRINLDELQNEIQKKIKNSDIICTGSDTSINIHLTNKKFTKKIQIFLKKKLNISLNNLNFKYIKKIPLTNSNKVDYKKLI